MLIATHPSQPGCAYMLENNELFFIGASEKNFYIQPVTPSCTPSMDTCKRMVALFRLMTDADPMPFVICDRLDPDHILPEWLHALKIHNLNPTHEHNTEHLIHTTTPRFIAHIDPDWQEITTITPIDRIDNTRPAFLAAQAFLSTLTRNAASVSGNPL